MFIPPPKKPPYGWIFTGGIAVGALLLWICFLLFAKPAGDSGALEARGKGHAKPQLVAPAIAPPGPPLNAEHNGAGGLFQESSQKDRDPVVEILNKTYSDLVMTLRDVHGLTKTDFISANSTRSFVVPEGSYSATVRPTNEKLLPEDGTVNIHNYKHYRLLFVVASMDDPKQDFHIGD